MKEVRARHVCVNQHRYCKAAISGATELLGQHDRCKCVEFAASVLRWVTYPQKAQISHFAKDFARDTPEFLPLICKRFDPLLHETAYLIPQQLMLARKVRISIGARWLHVSHYGRIRALAKLREKSSIPAARTIIPRTAVTRLTCRQPRVVEKHAIAATARFVSAIR